MLICSLGTVQLWSFKFTNENRVLQCQQEKKLDLVIRFDIICLKNPDFVEAINSYNTLIPLGFKIRMGKQ